jgi:hypothetical protein
MNSAKTSAARAAMDRQYIAMDNNMKKVAEAKAKAKKVYVYGPEVPIICHDCINVRMKCYNPIKKKLVEGAEFTCDKKVKKDALSTV